MMIFFMFGLLVEMFVDEILEIEYVVIWNWWMNNMLIVKE